MAVADGESRSASMVRVQVETCAGMREASGVFVGADLVATSDATTGASGIAVRSSTGVVRGQVVAQDAARGLSIVKVLPTGDGQRLTGMPLTLAPATVGESLSVLGFPIGRKLHAEAGRITAASPLTHSGNPAPGVAGDALVNQSGRLVGLDVTDDGSTSSVADAAAISSALSKAAAGTPVAFAACPIEGASMTSIHPDGPAVRGALARYVLGLWEPEKVSPTTGLTGLETAWNTLSPAMQKQYGTPKGLQDSYKGGRTSVANVDNLERTDFFTDTLIWAVHVDGPGKACRVHKQKVVLTTATGAWTIDQATDLVAPYPCEA